jgi:hypothetical protein
MGKEAKGSSSTVGAALILIQTRTWNQIPRRAFSTTREIPRQSSFFGDALPDSVCIERQQVQSRRSR